MVSWFVIMTTNILIDLCTTFVLYELLLFHIKQICISSVKYSYYWKYRHQKTICVETKCFEEKQKNTGIQSTDSVKRTCKDTQSFTSENKCISHNKSRVKSYIIYDSAQTSSNEGSLFSTVFSTTSTSNKSVSLQ